MFRNETFCCGFFEIRYNDREKPGSEGTAGMDSASEQFGAKLQALRAKKGMTQQQLAEAMFISRSTLANWEAGNRLPDVSMLTRLAACLDVPPSVLMDALYPQDGPPSLIVVEDEPILLKGFVHILSFTLPQAHIFGFPTGAEALRFAEGSHVDVAFLDVELLGESGIAVADALAARCPRVNLIFLTGHTEYMAEAFELHASGYLLKPLTPEKIRSELAHLRYPVPGLGQLEH